MRDRDRQSLQAWRSEWQAKEEAERIERDKPLRTAEAALQKNVTELATFTRNLIATGKDADFQIPASVAGRTMSVDEAREFNRNESKKFLAQCPDYYPCPENFEALTDYLLRNGVNIADTETYERAFLRLREYRLLTERPLIETPVEPEQVPDQVEVASPPAEPELIEGQDPATGRPQHYTKREVEKMDSLTYRKVFGLYGDNSPRFVYPSRF